jgi:hypothetical protein
MSFTQQGKPARIKSVYGHNTGTTAEDVYVCPANAVAEVTFIHVVNGGASTNTVEVEWYVAADSYTSHFLKGKSINASDYVSFNQIDLVLQPGDKIQVTPSSAGHIDTILTVTETFVPVG